MINPSDTSADAVVVGAGVIGLASAWRLAERGLAVTVVDAAPGSGASRAAAGMLAPVTELHYGEEPLLALNLESAAMYAPFVTELEGASGVCVGFEQCGTLAVAADADDLAWLDELHRYQRSLDLASERLTSRQCRHREPSLSPGVRGGLYVAGDHQVDPRRMLAALDGACRREGVRQHLGRAAAVETEGGVVSGVRLADGSALATKAVVLAAGAWTTQIGGLPARVLPPVRPVKGQIIRLRHLPDAARSGGPLLSGNVRGLVRGASVYLVPRADGEVVLGATVEEQGFDTTVTAGAALDLLRDAYTLVPGITELELAEISVGLRPGTPDNAPVIGPAGPDGVVVATGHYRNGVLLTPLTARAVADLVTGREPPAAVAPFGVARFSGALSR